MGTRAQQTQHSSGQEQAPRVGRTSLAMAIGHVLAAGVVAASAWPVAALAAETIQPAASARRAYDIPAGPLEAALNRFGREAGILLSFPTDTTAGLYSRGLRGSFSVAEALPVLLQGTGLAAEAKPTGGYALVKRVEPVSQREAPMESVLPMVRVQAAPDAQTAAGPITGYVARRSATATKTDTPLIETPQSISVVTSDQIEAQGSRSLRDVVGYTPGVGTQSNGYRDTDNLTLRGFTIDNSSIRRDGLRSSGNTFTGTQEPYGLERVDILRGAASLLYGSAEPGGLINLVTKRPSSDSLHEVGLEIGNYNRRQATADLGGKLADDDRLSYRLTLLGRGSDTFIDDVADDRVYVAPAFAWKPSGTTRITLLTQYQHSRHNRQWGLPPETTLLPNPNGRAPRERNIGEPGDLHEDTQTSATLLLEQALSEQSSFNFTLRRSDVDMAWHYAGRDTLQPDLRTLTRYYARRMEKVSSWTLDSNLQTRFSTGPLAHELVVGVDGNSSDNKRTRYYQLIDPIDIYKPAYGAQPHGDDGKDGYKQKTRALGVYLQDQIKMDKRWVLLLGVRHDSVKIDQSDYFDEAWSGERSSATTGRAGLVYLADNGLAPFVSFSQSFEPVGDKDRQGNRFKPTHGEQYEVGLRWQPSGSNTLLSASLYQLTQSHLQVPDPVDPDNFSIQTGKVRSRGVELEARTDVTRDLRVIASYTYTDARTVQASAVQPEAVGQRQPNTPYNQMSVWADYQFAGWSLPGLRLGLGMRYVGDTAAANASYIVPAFTVFDAGLSYERGSWRYALNLKNLADRTYFAECGDGYCNYGDPRKVLLTAQYRW
ncbi:TonB-dependent siderophore receptor [Roseateles sp.]|uniref:TonB-dependent siderophore receptor n=1 Tax=Roseateles sp. TaxID=1971397 RepID=UPI0039ECBC53